jgi:hypothetical protein
VSLTRRVLRWAVPFAITIAALSYVFQKIGLRAVVERLTPEALWVMIPSLLAFGAVAVAIEAECLFRLLPADRHVFGRTTAARIKAASYPLSLIHYALGAGALAVLLGRRTGRGVADAAGVVGLISMFDIGIQLMLLIAGLTFLGTDAPAVRGGIVVVLIAVIAIGFAGLRAKIPLGPLDRIRELPVFDAARTTRVPLLVELAALRIFFAFVFIALIWSCCVAFGVYVPISFLVAAVPILIVVAMIPSVAGLGTGQVAFVEVFGRYADDETLLACSLAFSAGLIVMRASMGLLFAGEFTREALMAAREVESGEAVEVVKEGGAA